MDYDFKDHPILAEEIITDIQAVAKRTGKTTLTLNDYARLGKFSYHSIQIRLGCWHTAVQKAGLQPAGPLTNYHEIEEEALIKNLDDIFTRTGKIPTSKLVRYSDYGVHVYVKYYGSWKKALKRFAEYKEHESYWAKRIRKELPPAPKEPLLQQPAKEKTAPPTPAKEKKNKPKGRSIPQRLRFNVLLRDGFRCVCCGKSPLTELGVKLHCDHIIPWSKGGKTIMENLRTLCAECNFGKGDMDYCGVPVIEKETVNAEKNSDDSTIC